MEAASRASGRQGPTIYRLPSAPRERSSTPVGLDLCGVNIQMRQPEFITLRGTRQKRDPLKRAATAAAAKAAEAAAAPLVALASRRPKPRFMVSRPDEKFPRSGVEERRHGFHGMTSQCSATEDSGAFCLVSRSPPEHERRRRGPESVERRRTTPTCSKPSRRREGRAAFSEHKDAFTRSNIFIARRTRVVFSFA